MRLEFLKAHQLNIMLFISGVCGVLAVLAMMSRTLSHRRRRILALLECAAMLLMMADRYAYIYRGDTSTLGFWMVRISNFLVYFLTLFITHSITLYLFDLFRDEGGMTVMPKRLYVCEILYGIGALLIVISQFTGLYYTFDAQNNYQRAPANILCYLMPVAITLLQMSLVLKYRKLLGHTIAFSLILNTVVPLAASIIQIFAYGLSLTNMTVVGMAILLYMFVLIDLNATVEHAKEQEREFYREEREQEHDMFEQTAEALASAIDAKDPYTHGHSSRVAIYSGQIAREAGKSDEECERVYFAALLHDVGKIGVPGSIINKNGKLTDEEFAQIKQHPVLGNQILSRIQRSPYLSIGAHYHHERYDGRGYPDGLKGEDIPEIARIIGVADAYDAMTSKRSYRDPIPQDKVREELVKGMGTQFDPEFAKIMLHLIDLDIEYNMKEHETGSDPSFKNSLNCENLCDEYTTGISIIDNVTRIRLFSKPTKGFERDGMPVLILFDALDGRIQDTEAKKKDLLYFEYGQVRFDGRVLCEGARKMQSRTLARDAYPIQDGGAVPPASMTRYDIEAVRYEDHMMLRISDARQTREVIVALPDSSRFSYVAVTGEHCLIRGIRVEQDEAKVGPGAIPRIAEEISYIRDCPQGDIPNVQVDRWRSSASEGIPVSSDMKLTFHAMSLPTARLIWHCPFVSVFTAKDGRVDGEGFHEYVLIRLDGENWESDEHAENNVIISHTADFAGWNDWKARFRQGLDCEVSIRREGSRITVVTENLGVVVKSVTTLRDEVEDVYIALTGDQCAITNIRVKRAD